LSAEQTSMQFAANVRFPPFLSDAALRSRVVDKQFAVFRAPKLLLPICSSLPHLHGLELMQHGIFTYVPGRSIYRK